MDRHVDRRGAVVHPDDGGVVGRRVVREALHHDLVDQRNLTAAADEQVLGDVGRRRMRGADADARRSARADAAKAVGGGVVPKGAGGVSQCCVGHGGEIPVR